GDIDVKENDKIILSVPYEVNVRKFSLPERFSQAFLAPDPGLLRETYGMDTGFKFECRPKLVKGEIVIPEFATPGFQRRIEKCRSLNLRYITMCSFHVGSGPGPGPFLGAEPGTEEYFRLVREYLQKVYDKFKQHELHHNLRFYVYDEPTLKELPLIKEVAKVVRGIDPEILIYGAIYINSWKAMDEEARMLIDGWWTGYGSYTPEFLRWARAHNKTVMAGFNCGSRHPFPSLFIDHPALSPRVISWINWKYGIDIITTWHTYHTVHSPDPYINPATFSHYNGDGVLIYPSGPNKRKPWNVPSIRLELLREGMADYEYFKILASLIEAAPPGPGREQAAETLRLAESLVTDARTFCREPEPYRRTRRQMADAIEQLHKHNASTVTEYDKP
ncbi:MAG: DUF4091 domain-containing protein, partial [Candidatus Pacebacteria bacterium]|nr:DUF4091 domain-containing protein [Candidatus Paceibacterota bacterium]